MENNKVKIARYKTIPFTVNYTDNGRTLTYKWLGSKNGKPEIKDIESYVAEWLNYATTTFKEGELVIVDETELGKELKENIADRDKLEDNIHTFEEIKTMLELPITKMKKELAKITFDNEKKFVIEVAKQIKLDSMQKQEFIAEWIEIDRDLLFDIKD